MSEATSGETPAYRCAHAGYRFAQRLCATDSYDEASVLDVIFICVPTPHDQAKAPDLRYVQAASEEIGKRLRKGQLIVLESTTYPGTTEERVKPILERSGLLAGRDFHLAFSPERLDPGNAQRSIRSVPKIVGGLTPRCAELACLLYQAISPKVVPVSSCTVAEMVKVYENVFRNVNIALVNELTLLCERMGLDVWEIIAAAATKPYGFMAFYPGPGVGGHCIPVDPYYLAAKAREYDFHARFIELAATVNDSMPYYVISRATQALGAHGKTLRGARALVLGVAYKKDVSDARESPSLKIVELLGKRGAVVSYHDPFVPQITLPNPGVLASTPLGDDVLADDVAQAWFEHEPGPPGRLFNRSPKLFGRRSPRIASTKAARPLPIICSAPLPRSPPSEGRGAEGPLRCSHSRPWHGPSL